MQMFVTTNYLLLLLLTTYLGRVELLIRADVALASLGAVPGEGCEHIGVGLASFGAVPVRGVST